MVEMKDLASIVLSLVFIGFIIAVGVIIQSKTYTAFADTANFNDSVTLVIDTPVGFTTTWIKSVTFVGNGSIESDDCLNYTILGLNEQTATSITMGSNGTNTNDCIGTMDITGTFKDVANSEASSATSSVLSATKEIASSWLGLIITVIILSLVLGLVMGAFGERR